MLSYCDNAVLQKVLQLTHNLIPHKVFSSLLTRAIQMEANSGTSVDLLLRYGADPNGNSLGSVPPALFTALDFTSLSERGFAPVIGTHINENVVSSLLNYGASHLTDIGYGLIPLHFLTIFALRLPNVATKLIETAKSDSLFKLTHEDFVIPYASVITTCLCDLAMVRHSQRMFRMFRMFHFALNPLLRSGVVLTPDFLEDYYHFLPNLASVICCHSKNRLLWGRFYVVADFIIQARGHAALDKEKLRQSFEKNQCISVDHFQNYIEHRFPLTLQDHCRFVINRNLPKGLKNRKFAVEQLDYPRPLKNFLMFSEFDPLPNVTASYLSHRRKGVKRKINTSDDFNSKK